MLRRIWNSVFGRRVDKRVIRLSPEQIPLRRASSAEIEGVSVQATGFSDEPVNTLTAICDAHWNSFLEESEFAPEDAFSESSLQEYNEYVNALNELGSRGPEILDWAIDRIRHSEYDAREQAAWLLGKLAAKNQLGKKQETVLDELTWLATRSFDNDTKEIQANAAAVRALGKMEDRRAVFALRQILTAHEWGEDELQWDAAEVLGKLVDESFMECDEPVSAAQAWLKRHSDIGS